MTMIGTENQFRTILLFEVESSIVDKSDYCQQNINQSLILRSVGYLIVRHSKIFKWELEIRWVNENF